ncbi:hypothetical protein [Achromobacter sp. DH1f]|uniref:hypothetical protein n=1 Tax=Achromobacter sp. DH1f TaxID=1397275 RepID=UPI0004696308|nr:hypothetical protein [Achromobacter sp. DH1f]
MKTNPDSAESEQIVQPVAAMPKTSRQQLEAYCPIDPSTSEAAPVQVSLRTISVDLLDGEDQLFRFKEPLHTYIAKSGWSKSAGGYSTALYELYRPKIPKRIDFSFPFSVGNLTPLDETPGLDLTRNDRTITGDLLTYFQTHFDEQLSKLRRVERSEMEKIAASLLHRKHEHVLYMARTFPALLQQLFDDYPKLQAVRYIGRIGVPGMPQKDQLQSKVVTMRFDPTVIDLYNPSPILNIQP